MCETTKRFLFSTLLLTLAINAHFVQGQQLAVQTDTGKRVVLGRNDIEALPRLKVTVDNSSGPVTLEGVTLKSVLEKAGIAFEESMKGKRLASCLMVEAADDYRLLNHHFGGFDNCGDGIALLELEFFSATSRDGTLDQIVADPHDHMGHDIAQLNFFDFST